MRYAALLILAIAMAGCGSTLAEIDEAAKSGDVPAKLRKCRAEARTASYVEQKPADEAFARYEACKKREGL